MTNQKIADFVRFLKNGTLEGTIDWEPTEQDYVFQKTFPRYSVRLSRERDESYLWVPVITIINEEGIEIEHLLPSELEPAMPDSATVFQELYDAAKRQAYDVEKAIDTIISEIKQVRPESSHK